MRPRVIFLDHGTLGALGALGALSTSLLLAACGGNASPAVDAGPCWPLSATPGGQVEIGTGDLTFEPLPATLNIITSSAQSDPYVLVLPRIHDLPPGNPDNILDPGNPKTMINLVVNGLTFPMGVDCPASRPYVAVPGMPGTFDMDQAIHVGFFDTPLDQVSGMQGRLTVEVVGSDRRYAKDEKLVTVMAP
jgi:hypothetical protein